MSADKSPVLHLDNKVLLRQDPYLTNPGQLGPRPPVVAVVAVDRDNFGHASGENLQVQLTQPAFAKERVAIRQQSLTANALQRARHDSTAV